MQETSGHKARFIVPIILPFIMTIFWNVRTLRELLPLAKVVCEGYVFTGVCLSQHALQVVSQHALQQVSGGAWYPSMLLQVSRPTAVTRKIYLSFMWSWVLFLSSFPLSWLCFIKVNHLFTLSYPHLFQILVSKMFPYKSITMNHSLSNLIISSQRLITISVSLLTPTVLPCLIIQVLNTRVWFLNAWYNPFHFCT